MQLSSKVLLLDIETTGLKREQDQIISIGLTYLNDLGTLTTTHLFLERPEEEAIILSQFLAFLKNYETIYSYYGKAFEFPFILARLEHYHLDSTLFLRMKLIDLKDTLKHFGKNRRELEPLFHYERTCHSTGYDIVKLYQTYITSEVPIYKTCIIEHQKEELASLLFFWELYMTLYESTNWQLIETITENNTLQLTIKRPTCFLATFIGKASDMTFSYHKGENLIYVMIPLYKGTLNHRLEPLKDYYYVESEHQLLHKSLAHFIPSNLKRKATKEECVISKESTFFPIVTSYKMTLPLWHSEKNQLFIEVADFSLEVFGIQIFHLFFQNSQKRGRD